VFSLNISLGALNTQFIKLARVVQMNRRLLQKMDFVIGLRRAEEMCLDQSIGMKKRLIEDLESQLRHKERQERWARGMKDLSKEVGDVYGVTDEVETTLEQTQNSLEDMQQGVDNLREMVEKLNEEM